MFVVESFNNTGMGNLPMNHPLSKKICRPALCLLLIMACAAARGQSPTFTNAIFWKIQKSDSAQPSYILGSCHILDTSKVRFPIDTLCQLIRETGSLCIEIKDMNSQVNQEEYMKYFMVQEPGRKLKEALGKSYYRQLKRKLRRAGNSYPGFLLNRFNPLVFSYVLSISEFSGGAGAKPFYMDLYFEDHARKRYCSISGLETAEQQMGWLFPDISYDSSISILKSVLDVNPHDSAGTQILDDYLNQEIHWDDADTILGPATSVHKQRNLGMARGIDSLIQIRPVFVIIGAAHLPYEDGVLSLLWEKGYVLTPVRLRIERR